jgi:hypothetical protein
MSSSCATGVRLQVASGKAQAETGRDIVARLAKPRYRWFAMSTLDLQAVARHWFAAKEGGADGRNALLAKWLRREMPELKGLADKLFDFNIVRAAKTE